MILMTPEYEVKYLLHVWLNRFPKKYISRLRCGFRPRKTLVHQNFDFDTDFSKNRIDCFTQILSHVFEETAHSPTQ